jgi:hypothetical protein
VRFRAVAAIAGREFRERWLLLPTALFVGVAPVGLANWYLPAAQVAERDAVGALYIVTFSLLAAGLVGASLAGRDLVDRRLGFYLARPVGWVTLLSGQGVAAGALLLCAVVLVILPSALTSPELGSRIAGSPLAFATGPLAANLGVLALVTGLSAGLFGIAFRVRSRWLLVDLLGLAVLAALARHALLRLEAESSYPHFTTDHVVVVCATAGLPFALGLAAQLACGRGDPIRAHRAFSLTVWSLLLALGMLGLVVLEQALAGGIDRPLWQSARTTVVSPDRRWEWVVTEKASWLLGRTAFLRRTDGTRVERVGSNWSTAPVFSADSRRVAWTEFWPATGDGDVVVVDLGDAGFRRVGTLPRPRAWGQALALSPDGAWLAVVDVDGLRVHALERGADVAKLALAEPARQVARAYFLDADTVCLRALPARRARAADYRIEVASAVVTPLVAGAPDACTFAVP